MEWDEKIISDFFGNKSYVVYRLYGDVLELKFYSVERDRNGVGSKEELPWRILRESNKDGTYDIVAITEHTVHGFAGTPLTGVVLYEGMSKEEWRRLVFSYVKGDFIGSLEREFEKARQIAWDMIDRSDEGPIPPDDNF